jgi:hypothetical protein
VRRIVVAPGAFDPDVRGGKRGACGPVALAGERITSACCRGRGRWSPATAVVRRTMDARSVTWNQQDPQLQGEQGEQSLQGEKGEKGDMSDKGDQGNPGPGQTQVFAESINVDTVVRHTVSCPPNWFVTGGGYSLDRGDLTIGASRPDTDATPPRYWEVAAANNQREPGAMTVYVVCASGA